jgi:hypothetical protein
VLTAKCIGLDCDILQDLSQDKATQYIGMVIDGTRPMSRAGRHEANFGPMGCLSDRLPDWRLVAE